MTIAITFPSSAVFWLNHNSKINMNDFAYEKRKIVTLPWTFDSKISADDAKEISEKFEIPMPLYILSSDNKVRSNNKSVKTRYRYKLKEESFVEITKEYILKSGEICRILVETPEMTFLHAASLLNKTELSLLGCELCGIYVYDKNSNFKQQSRAAITNQKSISDFIEKNTGYFYVNIARNACNNISDRVNSRIEAFLAVISNLSFAQGGYNLKRCKFNAEPILSEEGKKILNGRRIYCDLIWEEAKLIVEYDSDLTHLTSEQHRIDKKRANALQASGYTVIYITKKDLDTFVCLDQTFKLIRKKLELRNRQEIFDKYQEKRKNVLHFFKTFDSEFINYYETHQ